LPAASSLYIDEHLRLPLVVKAAMARAVHARSHALMYCSGEGP
jgi:hypothetical protein